MSSLGGQPGAVGRYGTPYDLPDRDRSDAPATPRDQRPRPAARGGIDAQESRGAGRDVLASVAEVRGGGGQRDARHADADRQGARRQRRGVLARAVGRASGPILGAVLAACAASSIVQARPLPERAERAIWEGRFARSANRGWAATSFPPDV